MKLDLDELLEAIKEAHKDGCTINLSSTFVAPLIERQRKLERVVEAIKLFDFQPFHQGICSRYRGGECDCTTSKITKAMAELGDE